MQKQRFIPVVPLIALITHSNGLRYHLLGSENALPVAGYISSSSGIAPLSSGVQNSYNDEITLTALNYEPVFTDSGADISEEFSNLHFYYEESSGSMLSTERTVEVLFTIKRATTEPEDESAGETTDTGVI